PPGLTADTVHVHDLYFLPVFARIAGPIVGRLHPTTVTEERRWLRQFDDVVATSRLRPDLAIGWERGRRHDFAIQQYVPVSVQTTANGVPWALAVQLAEPTAAVDAVETDDGIRVTAHGRGDEVGLRIVSSVELTTTPTTLSHGSVALELAARPDR